MTVDEKALLQAMKAYAAVSEDGMVNLGGMQDAIAAYESARLAALPKDRVEQLAKALCEADGGRPDALDTIKFITKNMRQADAFDPDGFGCYYYWRRWERKAELALDAAMKTTHQKHQKWRTSNDLHE
jgi:hypothetical protein